MRRFQLTTFSRVALVPALAAGLSLPVLAAKADGAEHPRNSTTDAATRSAPAASSAASKAQSHGTRDLRASEIIGMSVRNPQGNNIGQIDDIVVDMRTGEVRYAMLRFDPGIFSGEKLFAVPTNELRLAPDRNDVVYDMSEERLERASVERKDWNEDWLRDPEHVAKLDRAWDIKRPSQNAVAHRASDLIGKEVNNRSGDEIGEIEELVIDMANQKVHYAVMAFDPSWASPEKNFAFPLSSFRLAADKDQLTLDVDKSRLAAMKSFTDDRYARLNDPVWITDVDSYLLTMTPLSNVEGATASAGSTDGAMGSGTSGASDTVFGQLDQDHNGWLDRSETASRPELDRQWAGIDKDDDGRVSRDEFASRPQADRN